MKLFLISLLLMLGTLNQTWASGQQTLTVSLLIFSVEQRNAFEEIALQFQKKHPEIKVVYVSAANDHYKKNMQTWLEESNNIDVLHWAWAEQLKENARLGLIEPITDLWQQAKIEENFSPELKKLVTIDKQQYGMPYSSHTWGIYFRQSIFKQYNIAIPTTWAELLQASETLNTNGITPFAIGTADNWPSASWFDYLNLRINGPEFHHQLLTGHIPFTSKKVRQIFIHWQQLINKGYFIKGANKLQLKQVTPLLYRNKAGMILAGSFLSSQLSEQLKDDFSLFRFPTINPDVPLIEEVPTNIFIISKKSRNKKIAKQFLNFIAQPKVVEELNKQIQYIAPLKNASARNDALTAKGIEIIKNAQGYTQYLDRDAPFEFSNQIMPVLTAFIESGDVEQAVNALEDIRLATFKPENTTH